MVISSHVKSVVQMDAKSVVTAPSLRDLYDTLKNRTRALEALGEIPSWVYFVTNISAQVTFCNIREVGIRTS